MAVRDILTVPASQLKQASKPLDVVDEALRYLMDDMMKTMYAADRIGLAAIQIGVDKPVIAVDLSDNRNEPRFFVNSVITRAH